MITAFAFCCLTFSAHAQKYNFTHYDIEGGLIQSQINTLSQDASHRLWIGTLGGACRFDGKEFTAFSKENGLPNNFVYTVLCDRENRVWFGTHMGLACLCNKKLINYPIPSNVKHSWVTSIVEDGAGNIWLMMQGKLFKVTGRTLQYMPIPNTDEFSINYIAVNRSGILCAAVFQKGIYCLNGNTWANVIPLSGEYKDLAIRWILFDRLDHNKIYFIANNKLYVCSGTTVSAYPNSTLQTTNAGLLCVAQDALGSLWIGSSSGVYRIKNNQLILFTSKNGFTDTAIPNIYCDNDNNLWLATWGDGIYKYEGNTYLLFDQSQGVGSAQTIMGISRDKKNNIWLATDGNGVMTYDGKQFKNIELPTTNLNAKKVQCIYTDNANNIWLGSALGGVWKFDGHSFIMIPGTQDRVANAITRDNEGTLWMASPYGCYYYSNNSMTHVDNFNVFTASLLTLGKDSVLVGTQSGIRLIVNKKLVTGFKLNELESSNILCMIKYHNKIMVGTGDWGLFVWDPQTKKIKNYNVNDGFNSNAIYNMAADKHGIIWAGTGRGINRIIPVANGSDFSIRGSGSSKEIIAEANENSILYFDDKIWMGTTKGLVVYNTETMHMHTSSPHILIQSVNLFTADHVKSMADTSEALIPYNQNHLSISFLGVYLKNPHDVSYQYKLIGHDDNFCAPVKNTQVDYPSLPPGKYTFQVRALTSSGLQSTNTAQFVFEIIPPFYQTWTFRLLFVISLVLLGIGMQTYMHKRRLRSIKIMERIKREEKQKIRQQTAEDFHDDLGNKLTRITVLSDILTAKLDTGATEQKKLVGQIKQNAEALYNGTKDILWALDPKSDNLYEILTHIRLFGIEFFHDTSIVFEVDEIDVAFSRIKLPLEYCRNMTMIFKELLNNILKHAGATHVHLTISDIKNNEMNILLTDNGKGFDTDGITPGNGINNIKNRAARIGGGIIIESDKSSGTTVILKLKLKYG
ncbi:two-component regulator propeller domain-containing protein [Mucilaginibacter sp. PPCGB 2223]|uniref:ligand-binding sensor domain-containing protein n=1 Tax=Mucilaginibacter sp. PPCGB 2223 TaxID=1886027 RepID=UPI000B0F8402|nr:sensor histidine kinase [Mucilaginibacter sp. PPCGB 2223]